MSQMNFAKKTVYWEFRYGIIPVVNENQPYFGSLPNVNNIQFQTS